MTKKRVNVEISNDIYDSLKILSALKSKTLTAYVNELIAHNVMENEEALNAVYRLREEMANPKIIAPQEENEDTSGLSLVDLLEKHNLIMRGKDERGGHSNIDVLACVKTMTILFDECGYDVMDFVLTVLNIPEWRKDKYKNKRICGDLVNEVTSFVRMYSPYYQLDAKRLSRHLIGAYRGSSGFTTPNDIIDKITTISGEATLLIYNAGMGKKDQLPNLFRGEEVA